MYFNYVFCKGKIILSPHMKLNETISYLFSLSLCVCVFDIYMYVCMYSYVKFQNAKELNKIHES